MTAMSARISSDVRREHVLSAAISEFAAKGYHGASTPAIAKRAGISQTYIYALFPDKKTLFLAAHRQVIETIRTAFLDAARGAKDPHDALDRMGQAFARLSRHDELLCQLQGYAAAGDPEIREPVSAEFQRLFDDVHRASGA